MSCGIVEEILVSFKSVSCHSLNLESNGRQPKRPKHNSGDVFSVV